MRHLPSAHTPSSRLVDDLVRELARAEREGGAIDASAAAGLDLAAGYAVQDRIAGLAAELGRDAVGFKIGLTTPEARRPLGAREPGSGRLFADRVHASPTRVALGGHAVSFEVEVAVRVGAHGSPVSWCPAIEVVRSRWRGGPPSLGGWVADNASAESVCLGTWIEGRVPRIATAWASWGGSRLTADTAAARRNLDWLERHLDERGLTLEPGSIVLTGSIIGPVPVPRSGIDLAAGLAGADALSLEFSAGDG